MEQDELDKKIDTALQKLVTTLDSRSGQITIGDQTYKFRGYGAWVEPWEKWYTAQLNKIYAELDGYTKEQRWDEVAKVIVEYKTKKNTGEEFDKDAMIDKLFQMMEKPDTDGLDPEEYEKKIRSLYNKIYEKVIKKVIPDANFDEETIPMVWDQIKMHVQNQYLSAYSFLNNKELVKESVLDGQQSK